MNIYLVQCPNEDNITAIINDWIFSGDLSFPTFVTKLWVNDIHYASHLQFALNP